MERRLPRLLLASAALASLAACATGTANPPHRGAYGGGSIGRTSAVDPDASVYGLFLAGQGAIGAGDSQAAASYFSAAQAAAPQDAEIRNRALTAALLSGNFKAALDFKPAADTPQAVSQIAQLSRAVELLANNRATDAYAALQDPAAATASSPEAQLLRPWAAAGAGKWEAALAAPDISDRLYKLIGQLDQALLFERAKRYDEAETTFKATMSDNRARPLIVPVYGVFLERRGRAKDAVALYDDALAASPTDAALIAARARASASGKAPPMLTIRQGAAQALLAPAGSMLQDHQSQLAMVYLQMLLRLDPGREDARLMVAGIYDEGKDHVRAREIFAAIPKTSARYREARARLALSWQDDDKAKALQIAQETVAASPDDDQAQLLLADMLRANERYAESTKVLTAQIDKQGARADYRLYYMRGAGEDRAGDWKAAEADLQKALSLKPDDPELLNYVGYAWVSRGERVQEGLKMIEKAVGQEPDNGAYVDSLGWAYFKLGDYQTAIAKLEHATELDGGDAEINDHLGDAYWKAGRKEEARFKWRAVLTLEPDAEVKARAQAKLASVQGVDAVGPSKAIARQ